MRINSFQQVSYSKFYSNKDSNRTNQTNSEGNSVAFGVAPLAVAPVVATAGKLAAIGTAAELAAKALGTVSLGDDIFVGTVIPAGAILRRTNKPLSRKALGGIENANLKVGPVNLFPGKHVSKGVRAGILATEIPYWTSSRGFRDIQKGCEALGRPLVEGYTETAGCFVDNQPLTHVDNSCQTVANDIITENYVQVVSDQPVAIADSHDLQTNPASGLTLNNSNPFVDDCYQL